MKNLVMVAALAAMPAWAQDKPAAAPAASSAPASTPAPAAKAEAKTPEKAQHAKAARKPNPKRSEDARHCLDEKTNTEIIKCAEAYL